MSCWPDIEETGGEHAQAFETEDREAIRAALMKSGLRRFAQAGIRAARVDDICQEVGIAKGSLMGSSC